jgi:hypothetical protein
VRRHAERGLPDREATPNPPRPTSHRMRELAKLGITHYHAPVPTVASITPLEALGQRLIPVAGEL